MLNDTIQSETIKRRYIIYIYERWLHFKKKQIAIVQALYKALDIGLGEPYDQGEAGWVEKIFSGHGEKNH